MQINPTPKQPSLENPTKTNIDKLLNGPPVNAQDQVAYAHFLMMGKILSVFNIVSSTKTLCSLAVLQAGFNSADETAISGQVIGLGGLVLGATGTMQGIGNFEEAANIAKANIVRNNRLKITDEAFKAKDFDRDFTVKIEPLEEPCSHTSDVDNDMVAEVEEDAFYDTEETLSNKQDKAKDLNQEGIDEEDRAYDNVEKNKIIKLVNKDYEVRLDKIKSEANKIQSVGTPGQAAYYVAQGLSEFEKSKSQKEASIQQIQQDNQNQQENTADGLKKEIDKLADFNPFQANSSSLK